jgi:hypothetical protein
MASPRPRPEQAPPAPSGVFVRALNAVWRLFFTFERPPRNMYERQFVRARAGFYFLLGIAATLAAQVALERLRR